MVFENNHGLPLPTPAAPSSRPHVHSPRVPLPLVEPLGPELGQPLIGVLRLVLVSDLAIKLGYMIPGLVVERILLIRSVANVVGHSLDIVANLLVGDAGDVVDLRVLEAELITIVGVDLKQAVSVWQCKHQTPRTTYDAHPEAIHRNHVLDGGVALGLVEAIATRLVKGTKVLGIKARDVVLATKRIVLEDLCRYRLAQPGTVTSGTN